MQTYIELTRCIKIAGSATATIGMECTTPYKDYAAWVFCGEAPTLSVQPLYGGFNDGAAVVVNTAGPHKVFQVGDDELRPSTNTRKHPNDSSQAQPLLPELAITNNAVSEVTVCVYMAAIPGGV